MLQRALSGSGGGLPQNVAFKHFDNGDPNNPDVWDIGFVPKAIMVSGVLGNTQFQTYWTSEAYPTYSYQAWGGASYAHTLGNADNIAPIIFNIVGTVATLKIGNCKCDCVAIG